MLLRQQLWRLERLMRPELPGLVRADAPESESPACLTDHIDAQPLSALLPLSTEAVKRVLAQLAGLLWEAHQVRVTGLRFSAAMLAGAPEQPLFCLAPDLLPPLEDEELERCGDLQALAGLAWTLLGLEEAEPETRGLTFAPESALGRAIALLSEPGANTMGALRRVLGLLGVSPLPAQTLPARASLVGREWELDDLALRMDIAVQDATLQTSWLLGPPGLGLRRLVRALASRLQEGGTHLVTATCQLPGVPMAAFMTIARRLLGQRYPLGSVLPRALAPLAVLLPDWLGQPLPLLPPRLARLRLFNALHTLLSEVAAEGPLCLVLLDYEAADDLTRDCVAYMRTRKAGLPLLLCLAASQADQVPQDDGTVILPPLTPEQVEHLAEAWCVSLPLSDEALRMAWMACEGNPALLHRQCLRWLRHGGLVLDAGGSWKPGEATPEAPPGGRVRDLLRAVSVLGGYAELALVVPMLGWEEGEVFQALEEAQDAGWLDQAGTGVNFALSDEAAGCYAAMLPEDAAYWHSRAMAVLAPQVPGWVVAHHARLGGQTETLRALEHEAAARLLALGAFDAAAVLLEEALRVASAAERPALGAMVAELLLESGQPRRALEFIAVEAPAGPQAPELALIAAQAQRALGNQELATSALEALLRSLPVAAEGVRAEALLARAGLAVKAGELRMAQTLAEEALALSNRLGVLAYQAEASLIIGRALLSPSLTGLARGLIFLDEAVNLADACEQLEVLSEACRMLGETQLRSGLMEAAQGALYRHLELSLLLGDTEASLGAVVSLAGITLQLGYYDAALGEVSGIEFELIESERPRLWAEALAIRAAALTMLGYLHDPLRLLDQALRTARRLKDAPLELRVLGHLGRVLMFLGKYARAEEVCQSALTLAGEQDDRAEAWSLRLLLAEMRWLTGDLAGAAELLAAVQREALEVLAQGVQAIALRGLARIATARGRHDHAAALAAEAMELAESSGHLLLQGELYQLNGEIAEACGQADEAVAAYDAALSAADAMNSPHHRALALAGLSRHAADAAELNQLRARAADNLNVYLEQLTEHGKRDFLNWNARREVLEPLELAGKPAEAPSLLGLLKAGQHAGSGLSQDSFSLLDQVLGLVTAHLPLEELLPRMNETFMRLSQATRGMVYLTNEDGELRLHDRQSNAEVQSVLGMETACQEALDRTQATAQTLWVPDTLNDPDFAELAETRQQGLRGVLCVPLKVPEGQGERVLGCLYGDRRAPWAGVSDQEIALVEMMARYASVMIEVGLLQADSQRKTHRLEMLNRLSRALAGTLDLDELLHLALEQILQITQGEQGYVFFGEGLHCRASLDSKDQPIAEIQVSRSVVARVTRDRKPLAILDVGQDEELQQKASLMIRNVRSVMCVPLLLDDQLVGLIYISSPTANRTFTRHDLDLMTAISSQVALALQNAQAYETIKELNTGLEAKVKDRTAELEAALAELTETQVQLVETEKLATVGTLAGGVAHEINNPLGAILTNAQLLKLDIDDPELLDSLDLIEAGAQRCKEIVSALLRYSKEVQSSFQTIDILAVVRDALNILQGRMEEDEIELVTKLDNVPMVIGDATELRQVVANLFFNALDAVKEQAGTTRGSLELTLVRELEGVVLTLRDNGPGMPPEVLKRIFDPFFTTKRVGSGTGLGLSVCQRIIEKHGGRITVTSALGEGSTFRVILPVP